MTLPLISTAPAHTYLTFSCIPPQAFANKSVVALHQKLARSMDEQRAERVVKLGIACFLLLLLAAPLFLASSAGSTSVAVEHKYNPDLDVVVSDIPADTDAAVVDNLASVPFDITKCEIKDGTTLWWEISGAGLAEVSVDVSVFIDGAVRFEQTVTSTSDTMSMSVSVLPVKAGLHTVLVVATSTHDPPYSRYVNTKFVYGYSAPIVTTPELSITGPSNGQVIALADFNGLSFDSFHIPGDAAERGFFVDMLSPSKWHSRTPWGTGL